MIQSKSIIVKEFPTQLNPGEYRRFYRELRGQLMELYRPYVVFDLSRVEHLTAQGVDLLVRCIHQIADRDGELKFAAASPQTELVLELTQISGIAEGYESVDEALESWNVPARASMIQAEAIPVPQVA